MAVTLICSAIKVGTWGSKGGQSIAEVAQSSMYSQKVIIDCNTEKTIPYGLEGIIHAGASDISTLLCFLSGLQKVVADKLHTVRGRKVYNSDQTLLIVRNAIPK